MSPSKLLALATLGLVALSGSAFAADTATNCAADTDCAHGFTCQVSTVVTTTTIVCNAGDCAPSGTGGAARHDADGGTGSVGTGGLTGEAGAGGSAVGGTEGNVDPTEGGGGAAGSTTTTSTCQPAPGPCTTDSDCGADMVCHSETSETCSGSGSAPACPGGTKCDTSGAVTQSECTSQTVSTCTYKWALPCNLDTDCGAGFVCQPSIGGECSTGGTPVAGGTGGEANGGTTAPPAETCTTTMTYPGSCHAVVPACVADADCPSNWVCQDVVTRGTEPTDGSVGSAGASGSTGAAGESGSGTASGSGSGVSGGSADVAAMPNTKMCVAPYNSGVPLSSKDGSGVGGQTGTTMSSDPTAATGGNTGSGTTNPPERPDGTGGAGGTTTAGPSGTAAGGASGAHDTSAPASTDNSGGCAVIATGTPTGAALAMLVGLALVTRRRQPRRRQQ